MAKRERFWDEFSTVAVENSAQNGEVGAERMEAAEERLGAGAEGAAPLER
jgi:hypothetical protein